MVSARTDWQKPKQPLAVDANVSASHWCRSRLQILERAQIFSASYTITLRALHQPQGDKPKINTMSIEVAITSLRLVREPTDSREVEADYWLLSETWKGLFPVYRLEEDVGLLQEGAVRLSLSVLRACSYKAKAEAWHQGNAPYSSRGGW